MIQKIEKINKIIIMNNKMNKKSLPFDINFDTLMKVLPQ